MTLYETPRYVTEGVNYLDEMLSRHLYGVTEEQTPYGTRFDTRYLATSNTGHRHDLPGAPFTMHAYQWGDCTNEATSFFYCDEEYCQDEECWACKPNFTYPKSGFKLWWYKHSLRVPEANQLPGYEESRKMIQECVDWVLAQPIGSKKE